MHSGYFVTWNLASERLHVGLVRAINNVLFLHAKLRQPSKPCKAHYDKHMRPLQHAMVAFSIANLLCIPYIFFSFDILYAHPIFSADIYFVVLIYKSLCAPLAQFVEFQHCTKVTSFDSLHIISLHQIVLLYFLHSFDSFSYQLSCLDTGSYWERQFNKSKFSYVYYYVCIIIASSACC